MNPIGNPSIPVPMSVDPQPTAIPSSAASAAATSTTAVPQPMSIVQPPPVSRKRKIEAQPGASSPVARGAANAAAAAVAVIQTGPKVEAAREPKRRLDPLSPQTIIFEYSRMGQMSPTDFIDFFVRYHTVCEKIEESHYEWGPDEFHEFQFSIKKRLIQLCCTPSAIAEVSRDIKKRLLEACVANIRYENACREYDINNAESEARLFKAQEQTTPTKIVDLLNSADAICYRLTPFHDASPINAIMERDRKQLADFVLPLFSTKLPLPSAKAQRLSFCILAAARKSNALLFPNKWGQLCNFTIGWFLNVSALYAGPNGRHNYLAYLIDTFSSLISDKASDGEISELAVVYFVEEVKRTLQSTPPNQSEAKQNAAQTNPNSERNFPKEFCQLLASYSTEESIKDVDYELVKHLFLAALGSYSSYTQCVRRSFKNVFPPELKDLIIEYAADERELIDFDKPGLSDLEEAEPVEGERLPVPTEQLVNFFPMTPQQAIQQLFNATVTPMQQSDENERKLDWNEDWFNLFPERPDSAGKEITNQFAVRYFLHGFWQLLSLSVVNQDAPPRALRGYSANYRFRIPEQLQKKLSALWNDPDLKYDANELTSLLIEGQIRHNHRHHINVYFEAEGNGDAGEFRRHNATVGVVITRSSGPFFNFIQDPSDPKLIYISI